MKKFYIILALALLSSGCATYNVQQGKGQNSGFVVTRYDKIIPEYTVGLNGSFPDKKVAEERFKRRREKVEHFYKQMGYIENRFKQIVVEPPLTLIRLIAGLFRIPFIAVSDYKYNHNPQYKEKMDRLEDAEYNEEKERVKGLKDKLSEYIKEDLSKEPAVADTGLVDKVPALSEAVKEAPMEPAPIALETKPALEIVEPGARPLEVSAPEASVGSIPVETAKPAAQEKAMAVQEDLKSTSAFAEIKPQEIEPEAPKPNPVVVIIAKPLIGPSPLKVNFSGQRSSSPNGKIVSYSWDFGDGDKSNKPNPTNTYYSATYGIREFTAVLTVTDDKGMVSSSSATIQVTNK